MHRSLVRRASLWGASRDHLDATRTEVIALDPRLLKLRDADRARAAARLHFERGSIAKARRRKRSERRADDARCLTKTSEDCPTHLDAATGIPDGRPEEHIDGNEV